MNLNLTAAKLRSLLQYDAETGEFTWIVGQRSGMKAGYSVSTGYIKINIEKVTYLAHRLAWLYTKGEWPKLHIDHRNGKGCDNRFQNLRDGSQQFNTQNKRRAQSNSTTKILGVSFHHTGKYRARIVINRQEVQLGVFDDANEAQAAYIAAKRRHHADCTL